MISVCIPIWNVEKTIEATITSVFNQTIDDYEILVVDDRGSDNSMAIIHKLQNGPRGDKIRVIQHSTNLSLGTVRNTCITYARGEYIYFLDGDDILLPDCLEVLLSEIEKDNYDFVAGSVECRYDDGSRAKQLEISNRYQLSKTVLNSKSQIVDYALIHGGVYIPVWNKLYRHSYIEKNKIRALDGIFTEDEYFSFQVYLTSNKCSLLNKVTYIHYKRRLKKLDLTHAHCVQKANDYLKIAEAERRFIRDYEHESFYWDVAWRIFLLHYGEFARRLKSKNYSKSVPRYVLRYLRKEPIPFSQKIRYPFKYLQFYCKYVVSLANPSKYRIVIPRIND